MALTGFPKTEISVVDESVIQDLPLNGIVCLQGETLRGLPGEPVFVSSSLQFKRILGGFHPDSLFPKHVMRLLDAGIAGAWISRAHHYTDINDINTAEGTKSTITLTVVANSAVFTALGVGPGYDGITVTVTAAASEKANHVDITLTNISGSDQTIIVTDIPEVPAAADIARFNAQSQFLELGTVTGLIPVGSAVLTGGVQDVSAITDTDFNGLLSVKNGWYSFQNVEDAFRIANIHRPSPAVDIGLAAYCNLRLEGGFPMVFHIGTPAGSNGLGMKDYRRGEGSFSHTPVDSYLGRIIAGQVKVPDPEVDGAYYLSPGPVEVLALQAIKDIEFGPHFSAAGYQRGVVRMPSIGLEYNIGSADNVNEADVVYRSGVNAMINRDGRIMYWGNNSLQLDRTSLLSKENVADLVVYIIRQLRPLVQGFQFDPNDPETWIRIYNNVRPFIINQLVNNRAIRPIENQDWFWIGDQFVTDYTKVKFNTLADIDDGTYRARFVFVPIPATEQIGIDLVLTDSNSLSLVVADQA